MKLWKSIVGKLWMTIIGLVAVVLLVLAFFLFEYIDTSKEVKKLFLYMGTVGFLMTTLFAFFLSTKITQPLLELKKAADAITEGEYETRVTIRSNDELGLLADKFNHMAQKLEETIKDLNYEKEQLGNVLKSMTDAVITFDATGKIILTNPQGEKILQDWNQVSWEGHSTEEHGSGHTVEPLRSLFDAVVKETRELTSKIHVQNGVWSVVMTPLYTQDVVRGAVAVLRDVTEEDRLEKLRRDFVANVSHELRTPLSMLQGYSEALIDDVAGSPEERLELIQIIHDESLRMSRLVNNLLDLTRMEIGYIEMNYKRIDMNRLIQRVIRKFAAMSKESDVELLFSSAEEELMIENGDEDRLEQVLTNLVENAIRHSPQGGHVNIRSKYVTYNGEQAVYVEVEDHGPGIPEEDLPYIFERFYKGDKARTRSGSGGGGTGLGLAIARNLVRHHDGTIHVDSELGKGTTFSFIIPCDSARKHKKES